MEQDSCLLRPLFWRLKESGREISAVWLDTKQEITPFDEGTSNDWLLHTADLISVAAERLGAPSSILCDLENNRSKRFRFNVCGAAPTSSKRLPLREASEFFGAHSFNSASRSLHLNRRYAGPSAQDVRDVLIDTVCAEVGRKPYPAVTDRLRFLVAVPVELFNQPLSYQSLAKLLKDLFEANVEIILVVELEKAKTYSWSDIHLEEVEQWISDLDFDWRSGSSLSYQVYGGNRLEKRLGAESKENGIIRAKAATRILSFGGQAGQAYFGAAKTAGVPTFVFWGSCGQYDDEVSRQFLEALISYEHAVAAVIDLPSSVQAKLCAAGFPTEKALKYDTFLDQITARP